MVLQETSHPSRLCGLVCTLDRYAQTQFLLSMLKMLARRMERGVAARSSSPAIDPVVESAAALINIFCSSQNPTLCTALVDIIIRKPLFPLALHRACIAALDQPHVQHIMEKAWRQFEDKLAIQHAPVLQQEGEGEFSPWTSASEKTNVNKLWHRFC